MQKLRAQKGITVDYRVVDGANHFYNDKIDSLIGNMHDYLNKVGSGAEVEVPKKLIKSAA